MKLYYIIGFFQLFLWLIFYGKIPYYNTKLSIWESYQIARIVWID